MFGDEKISSLMLSKSFFLEVAFEKNTTLLTICSVISAALYSRRFRNLQLIHTPLGRESDWDRMGFSCAFMKQLCSVSRIDSASTNSFVVSTRESVSVRRICGGISHCSTDWRLRHSGAQKRKKLPTEPRIRRRKDEEKRATGVPSLRRKTVGDEADNWLATSTPGKRGGEEMDDRFALSAPGKEQHEVDNMAACSAPGKEEGKGG